MGLSYKAIVNGRSLCHYNKWHDPKNGHFTSAPGGSVHNPLANIKSDYDGNTKKSTSKSSGGKQSKGDFSRGMKATGDALSKAGKNVSNVRLHGKSKKTDLSQYSDAELQRIVNRMRNEQSYEQLTRSENVSKGQRFVQGLATGLTIAGGVVTFVGGAAGAYTAFTGKSPIELFKKKS